ncbi:MAG: TetR/AcrR family transcriptional regulator [Actinomycetota bacterium]
MEALPNSRERILSAAIQELEERGEAGLRIASISRLADASVASIYHFFANREGLVQAAQSHRYAQTLWSGAEEFENNAMACKSREEFELVIESGLRAIYSPERAPYRWTRINVLGSAWARKDLLQGVKESTNIWAQFLCKILTEMQKRGFCSQRFDPMVIAWWYSGTLIGRLEAEALQPDISMDEYNAISIAAVMQVIFGD